MTPREQNKALALFMGYKLEWQNPETLRVLNPYGTPADLAYCNGRTQEETINDLHYCFPNYHGDLNACHEVEKMLTGDQPYTYQNWLSKLYGDGENDRLAVDGHWFHCSADKKTGAILRTLNLWKE